MLAQIYLYVLLCIALLGIFRFRQLNGVLKIICVLLVYTAIHEWVSQRILLFKDFRMYWLYAGLSTALYLLAFRSMLRRKNLKWFLLICSIGFAFVGILKFVSAGQRFPSIFVLAGVLLIVFSALLGLFTLLQRSDDRPLYQNVHFLMTSNIIVYQCVFFTFLGYYNTIMLAIQINPLIVDLHGLFSIAYYLCFGIVFVLPQKSNTLPLNPISL